MSFAENAVQVFRLLRIEDLRVLQFIETAMSKREFVPKEQIVKSAALPSDRVTFALEELDKLGLIRQMKRPYLGYTLNYVGYDCLAINTFVKAGLIEEFGHKLGIGKEADVYDALTSEGKRVAVKFHRLGRPSFRQTRRKRSYGAERVGWLFQSRLAAEKEYGNMRLAYNVGVAVPEPLGQNRHLVVMGMIEGGELTRWKNLVTPVRVLRRVMLNVRKAYMKAGVVHADLSEYNIIVEPNMKILIIDWPQAVRRDHPNARELLARDVSCVLRFFARRFGMTAELGGVLDYVTGKNRSFEISAQLRLAS